MTMGATDGIRSLESLDHNNRLNAQRGRIRALEYAVEAQNAIIGKLEQKVAELTRANSDLHDKISARAAAIEESIRQLFDIAYAHGDGIAALDALTSVAGPVKPAAKTGGPMKRWVIVGHASLSGAEVSSVFSRWSGFVPPGPDAAPMFFDCEGNAMAALGLLFDGCDGVSLQETTVVELDDGRIVEARHA